MKTLLKNSDFFELIKLSFFGKNYSERQSYFFKLYNSYQNELMLLISLYYNFKPYSNNYLSFLRLNNQKNIYYQNFFDYLSKVVYLLEIGDYREILKLNQQVPNEFIFTLKYFLKGDFLNVGEDFVLSLIPRIYKREELYSLLRINNPMTLEKIDTIYGGKIKNLIYPFIYFKKPKGNYQFVLFVKDIGESYLSIKNKLLKSFLFKQVKSPYFLFGFLYDKQHRIIVPLFFTKNNKTGYNILNRKEFNLNELHFYPNIQSNNVFTIKTPQIKKFSLENEVKENAKMFLKKHLILNKKGLFKIKFQEKTTYIKVIDYYFEDYLIKGVILEGDIIVKTQVPDSVIENGIENLYLIRKDYYYNNEIFYSEYQGFEISEMRRCVCCNNFFKKSPHSQLCISCYQFLYKIAKWSIKENFVISNFPVKNDFQVDVEKYHIKGIKNEAKLIFKRDFSLLPKGYQFVLPFKNP